MPDLLLIERGAWVRGVYRRVLIPRNPPAHLMATDVEHFDRYIAADAGGFRCLAMAAAVAATSPDYLVYVPHGKAKPRQSNWITWGPPHGILFAHRHVQFRPSDWKELRNRWTAPKPTHRTVGCLNGDRLGEHVYGRRESDKVDVACHADTLILTASARALFNLSHSFDWAMKGNHGDFTAVEPDVTLRKGHTPYHRSEGIECITWTHWN